MCDTRFKLEARRSKSLFSSPSPTNANLASGYVLTTIAHALIKRSIPLMGTKRPTEITSQVLRSIDTGFSHIYSLIRLTSTPLGTTFHCSALPTPSCKWSSRSACVKAIRTSVFFAKYLSTLRNNLVFNAPKYP